MDAYFVRHTRKLNIKGEYLERLWNEDRVAIHYPEFSDGLREQDNESTESEDYAGTARTAMTRLKELGDRGGYVWAQSLVSGDAKVGVVRQGTRIEPCGAEWREPDGRGHRKAGDRAVLKTLRLDETTVRSVPPGEAMGLRAGKPRQGTIVRWKGVGARLANFVEGRPPTHEWSGLSTAQQEAACAEFLRLQQGSPRSPEAPSPAPAGRAHPRGHGRLRRGRSRSENLCANHPPLRGLGAGPG